MINIQLHNDCPATDTIVPNQFIDRFMPSANGEFVKVYLYLLRCIHSHASNCTISEIADKFNNTEMDIQRALRYWQKEGLLSLEETADGKLCGIGLLPFPEDSTTRKRHLPLLPRLLFLWKKHQHPLQGKTFLAPSLRISRRNRRSAIIRWMKSQNFRKIRIFRKCFLSWKPISGIHSVRMISTRSYSGMKIFTFLPN